jgi:hypothetical protein
MLGLGSYDTSSDEETTVNETPLNTAEVRAAKRAKQPVVNAFNMMRTSHRASSSTDNDPTNTMEGAGTVELDGEMPVLAATERGRSIQKKAPTKSGQHRGGGKRTSTEPASVSVETRLKEFPGQGFAKVMGNLRCAGCKRDLPLIKSSLEAHVQTSKHQEHLKKLQHLALVIPLAAVRGGALLTELERDLPLYVAAAHGFTADHGNVDDFTQSVLGWYKNHSGEIGAWAEASLIAFSFTPSSAAAERVFSLLKTLFGPNQDMALADFVQGSIMVRYNGGKRGTSF